MWMGREAERAGCSKVDCESVCVHMWTGYERGTPQCVYVHVPD